jgi:hypothetical protein
VPIGLGQLTWGPAEALANVVLPPVEYQCDQPQVEVTVLRRNGTTLLALANSSATNLESALTFNGSRTFRSAWGDAQNKSGDGGAAFAVPAYSIQIWEVT